MSYGRDHTKEILYGPKPETTTFILTIMILGYHLPFYFLVLNNFSM